MEIKVVSFNIWDLPLWFIKDRSKRLAGLINYLKELDADIICLQEAFDPNNRKKLIKSFAGVYEATNDIINHRRILGLKLFDSSGGLVIFSKFPILNSSFIPHNRFSNSTLGEVFGRKGVLHATVKTPVGNLEIMNIHLHEEGLWFADRIIRYNQLSRILEQVNANNKPSILVGDFNQFNLVQRLDFMNLLQANNFIHAGKEKNLTPSYRLENPYFNGFFNNPPGSVRLDYIFTRKLDVLKLKVIDYQVEILKPSLSDHDPVILTLCQST